jgi:tetracycline 7-halogenase / FADH2 O2-dependent halogenase
MNADFDLAVVGSGFGGSLVALMARKLGYSVVLLERGRHPRFAIGESSTPLANLLLEELCHRYGFEHLAALSKWGTWQQAFPRVACGLKRGFTFYHHQWGKPFERDGNHQNELLVAASPHDRIADTHWYRADFDQLLCQEACRAGVEYLDQCGQIEVAFKNARPALSGTSASGPFAFRTKFVIDATGPRGFLHRALELGEEAFDELPATQAFYTHFRDVRRWDELIPSALPPPYPVDDAALHHIFDGGWIWVLRFNNGLTSAGAAVTESMAARRQLGSGELAWSNLLQHLPAVRAQFESATPMFPFIHTPRLAFLSRQIAGPTWALLPSAAGFIDPLLSTGFPLTLLGVMRIGAWLEKGFDGPNACEALCAYAAQTRRELRRAARLVAALYRHFADFKMFSSLCLLYFAAVTFTETARRLNRSELAGSTFLLGDHAEFNAGFETCCDLAFESGTATPGCAGVEKLQRSLSGLIRQTITPVDVAGLTRARTPKWFPVNVEDLFASAAKLGATREEIEALCRRCGF